MGGYPLRRFVMPNINDFPKAPLDTERSSKIRSAWGTPPPRSVDRVPFEFWDGTPIPGGVNPLIVEACARLDRVFQSHGYELGGYKAGDDWCYNRRRIKGSKSYSLHSWAIALDVNATENAFSKRLVTTFTPQIIADVQAIKHAGKTVWAWGGHWGRIKGHSFDAMHFQINLTPGEARSMRAELVPPVIPDAVELGGRIEFLEAQRVDDAARIEVLEARQKVLALMLVQGAPLAVKADWVFRGVRGRDPDAVELESVVTMLQAGQQVDQVIDLLSEKKVLG